MENTDQNKEELTYWKDRCHDSTQKAAAGEGPWQGDVGETANLNRGGLMKRCHESRLDGDEGVMRVYILGEHLRQSNRRYKISEIELGSPQVIEEANEAVVRCTMEGKRGAETRGRAMQTIFTVFSLFSKQYGEPLKGFE